MLFLSSILGGFIATAVSMPTQPTQLPSTMQAVVAKTGLGCKAPEWSCLSLETVPAPPSPKENEVVFRVKGSSVDPYVIDEVKLPHMKSVIGGDTSGVVVAVGSASDCSHLSVGAEVWVQTTGAFAEYTTATCKATGLKPHTLSFTDAGTMPCVAVTSLQCLQATGAPWSNITNVTVAITSGQGGTGFVALQMAKRVFRAAHVITAASGDGIAFVQAQGADTVIDYTKQELFDALPDDSVDIVFDNYGAPGTADKAMRTIRSGGIYLVMDNSEGGKISKHPKAGVKQISFGLEDPSDRAKGLDILKPLFEAGHLQPHTQANYTLDQVKNAFNADYSGKVIGKLAIVP